MKDQLKENGVWWCAYFNSFWEYVMWIDVNTHLTKSYQIGEKSVYGTNYKPFLETFVRKKMCFIPVLSHFFSEHDIWYDSNFDNAMSVTSVRSWGCLGTEDITWQTSRNLSFCVRLLHSCEAGGMIHGDWTEWSVVMWSSLISRIQKEIWLDDVPMCLQSYKQVSRVLTTSKTRDVSKQLPIHRVSAFCKGTFFSGVFGWPSPTSPNPLHLQVDFKAKFWEVKWRDVIGEM